MLSYPGQSCRITSHETHQPGRVLSQSCCSPSDAQLSPLSFLFPTAVYPFLCPIKLGLIPHFCYFFSYLGVFQCWSLLFLSSSLYIQAQSSHSGEIGPLRLCSNVNVWSFIWSSDVILMMEELLLWTAGLVRSPWA